MYNIIFFDLLPVHLFYKGLQFQLLHFTNFIIKTSFGRSNCFWNAMIYRCFEIKKDKTKMLEYNTITASRRGERSETIAQLLVFIYVYVSYLKFFITADVNKQ